MKQNNIMSFNTEQESAVQPHFTMDMYCMQAVKNYVVEIFLCGLKYSFMHGCMQYIVADVEELGWSTFSVQHLSSNPYIYMCCKKCVVLETCLAVFMSVSR